MGCLWADVTRNNHPAKPARAVVIVTDQNLLSKSLGFYNTFTIYDIGKGERQRLTWRPLGNLGYVQILSRFKTQRTEFCPLTQWETKKWFDCHGIPILKVVLECWKRYNSCIVKAQKLVLTVWRRGPFKVKLSRFMQQTEPIFSLLFQTVIFCL